MGKLDVDAVPLGFALIAGVTRSDPNPLASALSNKRIRIDRTADGNFAAVLIDGPAAESAACDGDQRPARRKARRRRVNPLRASWMSETETPPGGQAKNDSRLRSRLERLRERLLAEGGPWGTSGRG